MKFFFRLFIAVLFMSLFISCADDDEHVASGEGTKNASFLRTADSKYIDSLSNVLTNDPDYINFADSYLSESVEIAANGLKIQSDGLAKDEIDSLNANNYDRITNVLSYLTLVYANHEELTKLSDEDAQAILAKPLADAINHKISETKGKSMPASANQLSLQNVVDGYVDDRTHFLTTYPSPKYQTLGLTIGETGECMVYALGAFIAENWGVIKDVYGLVQGGSITFTIVKTALQLAFPQLKAVWAISTLVSCLIVKTFW